MGSSDDSTIRNETRAGQTQAEAQYETLNQRNETEQSNANRGASRANYNAGLGNLSTTGGVDPSTTARIRGNADRLQTGMDTGARDRVRGSGVFSDMASTGGFSQADQSNIRARGLAPIGSFAQGASQELERRRNVQGGYSPGFDAASRTIRRDAARGATDAALNANLEIKDRVNANRMAGAQSLSSAELGINEADRAGINDSNAADLGLYNSTLQGRALGLGGLRDIYQGDDAAYQSGLDRRIAIQNARTQAGQGYMGLRAGVGHNGPSGWQTAAATGGQVAAAYYGSRGQ